MEIEILYGFTQNLGNFESERLQVGVKRNLDPGEDLEQARTFEYLRARDFVLKSLGIESGDAVSVNDIVKQEAPPPRRKR